MTLAVNFESTKIFCVGQKINGSDTRDCDTLLVTYKNEGTYRRFQIAMNNLRVGSVKEATSLRNILEHLKGDLAFQWHGLIVKQIVQGSVLKCIERICKNRHLNEMRILRARRTSFTSIYSKINMGSTPDPITAPLRKSVRQTCEKICNKLGAPILKKNHSLHDSSHKRMTQLGNLAHFLNEILL